MRIRRISIEIQIVFLCIFLVQARIRFCIIDGTIRQMVVCGQCSLLDTAVRNALIEFDISDPIFYRFDNQRRLMVVPISLYIALPAFRDIPNLSVWNYPWYNAYANVDIYSEMFKSSVFSQEHNVSVNGGSEKVTYYASFNYLDQGGLLEYGEDGLSRYNVAAKINANITKWLKFNYSTRFTRNDVWRPTSFNSQFYDYFGIRIVPRIVPCIRICRIRIHSSGKFSGLKIQHLLHHLVRKNLSTSLLIFVSFIEHHGKR